MEHGYRRFPHFSDVEAIKNAIGEMRGLFFPGQPVLNRDRAGDSRERLPDETWFVRTLEQKVAMHPERVMEFPFLGEPMFDKPLVGFVRGDDPIFDRFKQVIAPHHFTPREIMAWQAEKQGVPAPEAGELGVVSFVLPITANTRRDNAEAGRWCSQRWAQTRLLGEMFSQTMVREIVSELMARGILAVAPDVTPMFNKKRYPKVGWASPWSHRHVAYAAGLGTFGMHDFLITEKGSTHRLGSFVVQAPLSPDRERPEDIHANCLHYQGRECLACARRCPVGAITEDGAHDKEACYRKVAKSLGHCIAAC